VQKNRRYELYRSELVMFSVQPFAPHIPGNCDDILTHPPQVILTVLRRQIGTESLISYVRERHVEFFPCVFAAFNLCAVLSRKPRLGANPVRAKASSPSRDMFRARAFAA
jgi:hypothetical protein